MIQFQEEFTLGGEACPIRMGHGFYPQELTFKEILDPIFQNGSLIFYVREGSGAVNVNGQQIPLEPGCFGWLHSYHLFQFVPKVGEELRLLACAFDYAAASFIAYRGSLRITREVLEQVCPVLRLSGAEREKAAGLMEEFCRKGPATDSAGMLLGYSYYLEVSTLFLRCGSRLLEQGAHFWRVPEWRLLQHIFTYSNENLTQKALADLFDIPARDMGRRLQKLTGCNFSELLNRARVNRACDMLHFEGLTQHYIAFYVGYRSEAAFYRAFRDIKGMTPQQYKERYAMPEGMEGYGYLDPAAMNAIYYLISHYRGPVTLAKAAGELYMDKTAVNQTLKKHFGADFQTILTGLRMDRARMLLMAGGLPLEEIAKECGYSGAHTLIRIFKDKYQMTPGEYRQRRGKYGIGMYV